MGEKAVKSRTHLCCTGGVLGEALLVAVSAFFLLLAVVLLLLLLLQ